MSNATTGYNGSMKIKVETDTWILGDLDAIEPRGKQAGAWCWQLLRSCFESQILAMRGM